MRSLGKATAAILFATALFCDAASAKTLRVGSKNSRNSSCSTAISIRSHSQRHKASDLPVQRAGKYTLILNLKTAKVLDITAPPLLGRADEVIG